MNGDPIPHLSVHMHVAGYSFEDYVMCKIFAELSAYLHIWILHCIKIGAHLLFIPSILSL